MTKKEKWKILLDGLNLKVGDEIVMTSYQRYFSNSKEKGRYVRYKYTPTYYKIAEEERGYYLVERYKGEYHDSGSMNGDWSHQIYNILDDFDRPKDAKYTKETTILFPTRADYYRAHPEANIWKDEYPDYPGKEDKLQSYYEVVDKSKENCESYWGVIFRKEPAENDDSVIIRMKNLKAFEQRIREIDLLANNYAIRTVQTVLDLKEKK